MGAGMAACTVHGRAAAVGPSVARQGELSETVEGCLSAATTPFPSAAAFAPSPLPADPKAVKAGAQEIWVAVKEEMYHYKLGSKLLWRDMQTSTQLLKRLSSGNELTRRERQQLLKTSADMFRLVRCCAGTIPAPVLCSRLLPWTVCVLCWGLWFVRTLLECRSVAIRRVTHTGLRVFVLLTWDCCLQVPFLVFVIVPFMEFTLPFFLKLFPNMLPSTFQVRLYLPIACLCSTARSLPLAAGCVVVCCLYCLHGGGFFHAAGALAMPRPGASVAGCL
jgi:hypothetical protein